MRSPRRFTHRSLARHPNDAGTPSCRSSQPPAPQAPRPRLPASAPERSSAPGSRALALAGITGTAGGCRGHCGGGHCRARCGTRAVGQWLACQFASTRSCRSPPALVLSATGARVRRTRSLPRQRGSPTVPESSDARAEGRADRSRLRPRLAGRLPSAQNRGRRVPSGLPPASRGGDGAAGCRCSRATCAG